MVNFVFEFASCQATTSTMIQKFPLPYAPASEERIIHLYLPDEYYYASEADVRYPVIYMFDGHNLFFDEDATYGKSWGLKTFLDHWQKRMIIVGMECSHTGNERIREYSPYRIRTRMTGTVEGIGNETMQWIVNCVKPFIDSHYRTWSHREATAIAGSSMGGMMSLFGILRYNDVFSKAACVSPAVGFAMPQFKKETRLARLNPDTLIFFSWGTDEWKGSDIRMTRNILNLEALAQAKGASTWLYHQQGGRHCEADWEVQVPTWMEYLFGR